MTAKYPQKQGRMLEGGGRIILAGQNIYPWVWVQPVLYILKILVSLLYFLFNNLNTNLLIMSLKCARWIFIYFMFILKDKLIHEKHKEAVSNHHFTYDDPATGLKVITRLRHYLKGSCCGSACRNIHTFYFQPSLLTWCLCFLSLIVNVQFTEHCVCLEKKTGIGNYWQLSLVLDTKHTIHS